MTNDPRSLVEVLADQSFFHGFSDKHLADLAGCASDVEYQAGETVFEEAGQADACYLLVDGAVALELKITGRGHHIIQTLHRGEVLGWSWLFPPYRWAFGALAIDPTHLVRFDAVELRRLQDADHDLGYELTRRFANVMMSRLQATRLQLVDFYGHSH